MAVAGYEIRIDGGVAVDVGNVLSYLVTGLTPSTEYDFEVRAYDGSGNRSGWSTIATETTESAPLTPFDLIASVGATGAANSCTTGAIDTTGADILVVAVAYFPGGGSASLSDSKGNTWSLISDTNNGTSVRGLAFYVCEAPTVGSGHTFTQTGTNTFASVIAEAWQFSAATALDQNSAAGLVSSATIQPGSITPTEDNELVITAFSYSDAVPNAPSVDSGFTISHTAADGTVCALSMAHKVQTTAAAVNPTWTNNSGAAPAVAAIASFKHI